MTMIPNAAAIAAVNAYNDSPFAETTLQGMNRALEAALPHLSPSVASYGLWVHPDFPDCVVLPHGKGSDAISVWCRDMGVGRLRYISEGEPSWSLEPIAAAYFEAMDRDEDKPWRLAKPGEIWKLSVEHTPGVVVALLLTNRKFVYGAPGGTVDELPMSSRLIVGGERVHVA